MRIDALRSQLLLVDWQTRLTPHLSDREATEENLRRLLVAARRLEAPVLVSEQYPSGLGPTEPALQALIAPGEVLAKTSFSCLGDPALAVKLSPVGAGGRDQVVVCGAEAHVCVLQTALDLAQSGVQAVVVVDAVASRTALSREVAFRRLEREGVCLATTEMVIFEWLRDAAHPAFREMSRLVR